MPRKMVRRFMLEGRIMDTIIGDRNDFSFCIGTKTSTSSMMPKAKHHRYDIAYHIDEIVEIDDDVPFRLKQKPTNWKIPSKMIIYDLDEQR